MKFKVNKSFISISLILTCSFFILLQPVYILVNKGFNNVKDSVFKTVEEQTGLTISYKSMSPSILSGIHLKEVSVKDSTTENELVYIKNVSVSYNLWCIITQKWDKAFKKITISRVLVDIRQSGIEERFVSLVNQESTDKKTGAKNGKEKGKNESVDIDDILNTIKRIVFSIPTEISLKNIYLMYEVDGNKIDANLKLCNLKKDTSDETVDTLINGTFLFTPAGNIDNSVGFKYKVDGKFLKVLNGSSFKITLDKNNKAVYTFNKIENIFRYQDHLISLSSIQQILPYSLYSELNTQTKDFTFNLYSKDLDIFKLFSIKRYDEILAKLKGTQISCNTNVKINFSTFKYNWNSLIDVYLSKKLSPTGQIVSFNGDGNNKIVNVNYLNGIGDITNFNCYASFDIPKLQPSGMFELLNFNLPNGNSIDFELYCETINKGFMIFIPQLNFGNQSFTALQLNVDQICPNINFTFDLYDYSHYEYDSPANLKIDGIFATGNKSELQAEISLDNFFLDSVGRLVNFFNKPKNDDNSLEKQLAPYISSTKLYVSTDFKSFTFNSPYTIVANTKQQKQYLFTSFDGSDSSVNLSQLFVIFDTNTLDLTAHADFDNEDSQVLFNSNFNLNNIPYNLDGIFASDGWLNIVGEYGLEVALDFTKNINGRIALDSLPISLGSTLFLLSFDSDLSFDNIEKYEVKLNKFAMEEISNTLRTKPKFFIQGKADQKGVVLDTISMSDTNGVLAGTAFALINISNNTLYNVNIGANLTNDLSEEAINIKGELTNPFEKSFEELNFNEDIFFNLVGTIKAFPMSTFLTLQTPDDTLNCSINASGNINNPYLSVDVSSFSIDAGGLPLTAKANASLVENQLKVESLEANFQGIKINNVSADFDLQKFNGNANVTVNADLGEKYIKAPLSVKISNLSQNIDGSFPELFAFNLECKDYKTNLFEEGNTYTVNLIRSPGRLDILSDENIGLSGEYLDDGSVNVKIDKSKPLRFNIAGKIADNTLDLHISDIYINSEHFAKMINTDYFSIYKGEVFGNLNISGLMNDPILDGLIQAKNLDFNLPLFVPEHITTSVLEVELLQDEIAINETSFKIADGLLTLSCYVGLDRWQLSNLDAQVFTGKNRDIPVAINVPFVSIVGKTGINLNVNLNDGVMDLNGGLSLRNCDISLLTNLNSQMMDNNDSQEQEAGPLPIDIRMALNLDIGSKVSFIMNPLLRGLIAPGTSIGFNMDTASSIWNINGDVVLRGGEVSYLNRNFYLKEGRINLNETQSKFDPQITLRAETRDRDDNNEPVTIALSAIRQNASSFKPLLYSVPAKSEKEIMEILGQIASADSDNVGNFLMAGVDYTIQVTVMRKLEGALRELCNFDIFSVRTTLLQNSIKQGFNINTGSETGSTLSNLFDNSTVYIGKYFGPSIYADAMMHWTYDESRAASADTFGGGLVFRPEVGLEFEAPFGNIRWSFAPEVGDAEEFQQSLVSAQSITLSWRLTF